MNKDMQTAENLSKDTSREVENKNLSQKDKVPTENNQEIRENPDNISDPDISSGVC